MKLARIILFPLIILGAWGAVLLWADLKATKNANKSEALSAISHLILACESYFEEYQQFPLGSDTNTDQVQLTNGKENDTLMTALCSRSSAMDESYKTLNFFTFDKKAIDGKDGLLRNEDGSYAELFDPWGSPYHVLLDYDYNNQLRAPFTGKIIPDKKILIWSPGPDKESGTEDDIRSWE